mmetsp:Transcript_52987/g.105140  ORF Transcript_52987/g.105140 Transcript_52987/m.105140 type:complete len:252 (+) Transcript_52987:93-848(+)
MPTMHGLRRVVLAGTAAMITIKATRCQGDVIDAKRTDAQKDFFSARVISRKEVASTRWLKLQTILYQDQRGKDRLWDVCTRTTRDVSIREAGVDAVAILALLRSAKNQTVDTLIVQQFRPPVDSVTVELPAGLVDAGETPEVAALRELKEETGYVGSVSSCSPPVCMSPGLCDETIKLVVVDVDMDDAVNKKPKQALEESEFIVVKRVPLHSLASEVCRLEAEGALPFVGLHLLALGLQMGQQLKSGPVVK